MDFINKTSVVIVKTNDGKIIRIDFEGYNGKMITDMIEKEKDHKKVLRLIDFQLYCEEKLRRKFNNLYK